MTPSECRDYLGRLQHFGIKLGLENISTLCAALGNPQTSFLSIHVAGTNGKGSVSAMLDRILRENGLKTGLYTSPHLVRVEERIRVHGTCIGPKRFRELLTRLKTVIDRLMSEGRLLYHPTYFEVLTALAFLEFAERRVDVAILEVGMGGRFDATNVVRPLVSVITTIAKDHEKHLGSTLREIAFEKAGIIKPGVPVVCGVRGGEAHREIRRVARERNAPVIEVFGRAGRSRPGGRAADTGSSTRAGTAAMPSPPPWPAVTRGRTRRSPSPPPRSCRGYGGRSTRPKSSRPSARPAGKAASKRSAGGRSSSSTAPITSKASAPSSPTSTRSSAVRSSSSLPPCRTRISAR